MDTEATEGLPRSAAERDWIIDRLRTTGTVHFVDEFAAAVTSGRLAPGAKLPTLRDLVVETGYSFRSLSEAWAALRERRLIETRRRAGTFVAQLGVSVDAAAHSTWHVNLSVSNADAALLPPLAPALSRGLLNPHLHSFVREYITDDLAAAARASWEFDAAEFTASGYGAEAIVIAIEAANPAGGTVAVDQPSNSGLLGALRRMGMPMIGVDADAEGPLPDSLDAALDAGATTYVFHAPRPYGVGDIATPSRLAELVAVLDRHPHVQIVEDDPVGPLAEIETPTFGKALPGRVTRVRSFCRVYGSDLRVSITGGPAEVIERSRQLRSHGMGFPSRIMQDALAFLMTDEHTNATTARAREVYRTRRERLTTALQAHGLTATSGVNGQFVWVRVPEEVDTILALAANGLTVADGQRCFVLPQADPVIRIATMRLPDEEYRIARIAEMVAEAVRGTLRYEFH